MSDPDRLSEHLRAVFDASADAEQPGAAKRRQRFVFHMLDWQDDLKRLAELYAAPEPHSADEARAIVQSFLYHAEPHREHRTNWCRNHGRASSVTMLVDHRRARNRAARHTRDLA
jgi:hypothetical protein